MQKRRKLLKESGPKYQQVLDLLSRDILAGKYKVRAEISERGGPGPPRVSEHALLWGSTESTLDTKEAQALKLCH
jgi:hypothetical protein